MSREDLIPIYLSRLEEAKFELAKAERASNASTDVIEKVRWSLEMEIRRSMVRVYDVLVSFVQRPEP